MKLTKVQKIEIAKQMAESFKGSESNLFFTQYQGLKFLELAELRKKLKPFSAKYQVVKNSIISNALKNAGIPAGDASIMKGPIGLVVAPGTDPVSAAKVLAAFAKEFPKLKVKAAYVDGQWLNPTSCAALASLGTKPEVLSSLLGMLQGSISQVASLMEAPIRDFALVLQALKEQKEKSGEAPVAAAQGAIATPEPGA